MNRLLIVDNQMAGNSFVSLGPLVIAAIAHQKNIPVSFSRFPKYIEIPAFIETALQADIVAFSTICSNYPRVFLLIQTLKHYKQSILTVLGGPQATTTAYASLMKHPGIDLIIRGEAEIAWSVFTEQVKSGIWNWNAIPGAVWREGMQIRETPVSSIPDDLDTSPLPLFDLYTPEQSYPTARVEVGRGCPYNCTFCSTSTFFSRKFRMKSPSRILEEMNLVHQKFGISNFDFVHDMFTSNRKSLETTCERLSTTRFTWGCWSRTDVLSTEILELLYQSGCRGFFFGLETGSERMQKRIRKNLDLQHAIQVIRQAKSMGFSITASLLLAYPGETIEDLKDTLILACELMGTTADQLNFLPFAPLAGTDAFEETKSYAFDGFASNIIQTERNIYPEEAKLIASDFELFSAFYYPSDNIFKRADYMALVMMLDNMKSYSSVVNYTRTFDRSGFINFATQGNFNVDIYKMSEDDVFKNMLTKYALSSSRAWPVRFLFDYDVKYNKINRSSPGTAERGILPVFIAKQIADFIAGPDDFVGYTLRKNPAGPSLSFHARDQKYQY